MRPWCFALAACVAIGSGTARAQTHVACVGDSITYGDGTSSPAAAYPAVLQGLLGSGFAVENDGYSGATMLKAGDIPYWNTSKYTASTTWAGAGGDVVIQLGTNDSKPANWSKKASFLTDCEALIDHYRSAGGARVWISLIPPATSSACCKVDADVIENEILSLLQQCAANRGATTIDVHAALATHPDWFKDGVHPNDLGAALIAETVHAALTKLPTIDLAASASSTFAPASVMLTATPTAAYGKVERVELYDGAVLVKELASAPWTTTLSEVSAGSHVYSARLVETGGRTGTSAPASIDLTGREEGSPAPGASRGSTGESGQPPRSGDGTDSASAQDGSRGGGCASAPRGARACALASAAVLFALVVFAHRTRSRAATSTPARAPSRRRPRRRRSSTCAR